MLCPYFFTCRLTMAYLSHAWGVGPTTFRRWKKEHAAAAAAPDVEAKAVAEFNGSVIVNRDLALKRFTPKYLFAVYHASWPRRTRTSRPGA